MSGTKKEGIKPPKVKTKEPSEHEIQSAFVAWARLKYTNVVLFSIPNGTRCSIGTARKMVKEGALKGVPDIFVALQSGLHNGLFLEFKTPKGAIRDEQLKMMQKLKENKYACWVVRSVEEAQKALDLYVGLAK